MRSSRGPTRLQASRGKWRSARPLSRGERLYEIHRSASAPVATPTLLPPVAASSSSVQAWRTDNGCRSRCGFSTSRESSAMAPWTPLTLRGQEGNQTTGGDGWMSHVVGRRKAKGAKHQTRCPPQEPTRVPSQLTGGVWHTVEGATQPRPGGGSQQTGG